MKVLLINEHIYGAVSNEETFWSVLPKRIDNCEAVALKDLKGSVVDKVISVRPEIVVFNSILGDIKVLAGVRKIVFLQDNFLAMKKLVPLGIRSRIKRALFFGKSFYDDKIRLQREAINGANTVVTNSADVSRWYGVKAEIIPIGVNTDLFKPLTDKARLKEKYGIPAKKITKIFVGSTHRVKGYDLLLNKIKNDTDSFYILVLKDRETVAPLFSNVKIFQRISQSVLAELYNCSDVFVGRSRVETEWLAPLEAMFCGVPVDVTPVGVFADWKPENKDPRAEAFAMGLDQETMVRKWKELFSDLEIGTHEA